MARQLPLSGEHYLSKGKVWQVVHCSRSTAKILVEEIETRSGWWVNYDTFFHGFKRVWKVGDVAQFLERSPRSIYRYERAGHIKEPMRHPDGSGREIRFYTKEDVLEIHEMISEIHQGRPRKDNRTVNNTMPSRYELSRMFRERFGV